MGAHRKNIIRWIARLEAAGVNHKLQYRKLSEETLQKLRQETSALDYQEVSDAQRLYYFRNLYKFPTCDTCGRPRKFVQSNQMDVGATCGEWTCRKAARKATCMRKYGASTASGTKETKERNAATCLLKYGTERPAQNKEISEKQQATNVLRYGGTSPFGDPFVAAKVLATMMERYGVVNYAHHIDCAPKKRVTNMERYGMPNSAQDAGVRDKALRNSGTLQEFPHPAIKSETVWLRREWVGVHRLLCAMYPGVGDVVVDGAGIELAMGGERIAVKERGEWVRYYPPMYVKSARMVVDVMRDREEWEHEIGVHTARQLAVLRLGYQFWACGVPVVKQKGRRPYNVDESKN